MSKSAFHTLSALPRASSCRADAAVRATPPAICAPIRTVPLAAGWAGAIAAATASPLGAPGGHGWAAPGTALFSRPSARSCTASVPPSSASGAAAPAWPRDWGAAAPRGGEVAPHTVPQGRVAAAEQRPAFSRHVRHDVRVRQGQRAALVALRSAGKAREGSAAAALARLARSPQGGWVALAPESQGLRGLDVGERAVALAQRWVQQVAQGLAPDCAALCLSRGLSRLADGRADPRGSGEPQSSFALPCAAGAPAASAGSGELRRTIVGGGEPGGARAGKARASRPCASRLSAADRLVGWRQTAGERSIAFLRTQQVHGPESGRRKTRSAVPQSADRGLPGAPCAHRSLPECGGCNRRSARRPVSSDYTGPGRGIRWGCTRRCVHTAVSFSSHARSSQTRTKVMCPRTCCGRRACALAATTGVHDTRKASGHQRDRDLCRDVTPDPQPLADAMDAWAGEALPLL